MDTPTDATPPARDLSCLWCAGYTDGYGLGANGLDPGDYDPTLFLNDAYRDGMATGREDRIDADLLALTGTLPDLPV